jgi:hypothetical protein
MALPAIGYLTSGKFDGSFKDHFLQGLLAANWNGDQGDAAHTVDIKPKEANGDYDSTDSKQTLNKGVKSLNNDDDVKLIVAVGGLVSAFAAAKHSEKPYLVLIGQMPDVGDFDFDMDGQFCGGINLDMVAANATRNERIAKAANCRPDEVCLVFNTNARMARAERQAWKNRGWPTVIGGVDADGDNDDDDFKRVFKRVVKKRNAKAIVISSDPFFARNRDKLVREANAPNSTLPVCYPSQYFAKAVPAPTSRDMWYGPDLDEAYRLLGEKAGGLLTQIIAGNATFMGLDTAQMLGPQNFP